MVTRPVLDDLGFLERMVGPARKTMYLHTGKRCVTASHVIDITDRNQNKIGYFVDPVSIFR
jgi:hypothetical protein